LQHEVSFVLRAMKTAERHNASAFGFVFEEEEADEKFVDLFAFLRSIRK
jgi:hypothetical protein